MNSNKMTARIADTSQRKAAKIAGLAYLIIIITSMLGMIVGPMKLIVKGNNAATFNNIMANQLLFRLGTSYDLLMFASVIILAVALYVVLKPVNKNLALLALCWRLGEAILGCLMVFSSLIVLLLINGEAFSTAFETEQLQAIVGLLLEVNSAVIPLVWLFISLGTIVYCYLFFKSRYIPRILAAFGIFSFLLTLIGTFILIILPFNAWMVFGAPSILFEVIIGLWLLIKGVNVEQWEKRALESA